MKKLFSRLACAFGLVMLLASTALAADAVKYVNGIDANYPPFAFIDKDGKATGFDVESMNWIAKKMGFEIEHRPMDWDGIIASLLAKKIDMVCSGMSISPERKEVVAFSEPYFTIKKFLVAKNDSAITKAQILTGKKILGVQRGTNEAEWLAENAKKNNWNFDLRLYDSPPLVIEDLLNGRIDAGALDSAPANDAINVGKKPIKIVDEFADPDEFGVAVRKDDAKLLGLINEGYKLLKADPHWKELEAKYKVNE